MENGITYAQRINEQKNLYPFERWKQNGLEQYTNENCEIAKAVMDNMITELIDIGEDASIDLKIETLKKAVLEYDVLNEQIYDLIATIEREDLCDVFNGIAVSIGIDIEKFDNDITQEWRGW